MVVIKNYLLSGSILEFQVTDIINMFYTQLIKILQRNRQQISGQYSREACLYSHKRNACTVLKRTCRHMDAISPRPAVSSYPVPTLGCRSFSLYLTARNKSLPEDRDKSVSRYQSGTPKASTAQKGKTSHLQNPVCQQKIKSLVRTQFAFWIRPLIRFEQRLLMSFS